MIPAAALTVVLVIAIPVVCATVLILGVVTILKGKSSKDQLSSEEARLLQQIHQGMGNMEKRVEALETIVIEREKKREHSELS